MQMRTIRTRTPLLLLAGASVALGLTFLQSTSAAPLQEDEEGFTKLGPPKAGEWRDVFKEPAQSYEKYITGGVNRKGEKRTTFYIQPLGDAGKTCKEILEKMRLYAEAFFGMTAKLLEPIPMFEDALDKKRSQYDSTMIIHFLADRIPDDALVVIGITEKDLYSEGLNFVFGEASLNWRCGVYSLVRYQTKDEALFTRRGLKLLAHESGHILSIEHCVTYSCVMQGANNLREDDTHPMHLCPIDLKKVLWNTGMKRDDRYRKLQALYDKWGLKSEAAWVAKRLGAK
jgi:archaemetzincin